MAATSTVSNPSGFSSLVSGIAGQDASVLGGANLTGASGTGGFLGSLYGQVPGVSNPLQSTTGAIEGNVADLGQNAKLAQGTDIISAEGAQLPYLMNLPGYQSMLNQDVTNTSQELSGQVPQDVQNQIQEAAAERGVATGQDPSSPNNTAAYLQALGLTSLGEQQTGASNLSQLIGETPTGQQYSPESMFTTPQDEQAANQAVQNAQAAPDPGLSGIFSSIMSLI